MITEKSKILIVDDFETVRVFLRNALSQLDMTNVEEASNGKDALALLSQRAKTQQPFELVFCDWNMPEMTGMELLRAVRQDSSLAATPFVMVTAESETEAVIGAVNAGATDYIVKPFSVNTLRSKIQTIKKRLQKAG